MKRILGSLFTLFIFFTSFSVLADPCPVYFDDDYVRSGDLDANVAIQNTFRYIIEHEINNKNKNDSSCNLYATHPDAMSDFDMGIYFMTAETEPPSNMDPVKEITLKKNLTISPIEKIIIGNPYPNLDSETAYTQYTSDYDQAWKDLTGETLIDLGMIILNARDYDLTWSGSVYWRNTILLTQDRLSILDAGNAFVCDGELQDPTVDPRELSDPLDEDYLKWCDSDSVSGDTDDGNTRPGFECEEWTIYWVDNDGDGYGNPDRKFRVCTKYKNFPKLRSGFLLSKLFRLVENGDDCNDNNALIHPSATELCDGIDNNCNNSTDETFTDLGNSCSAGVGICESSGIYQCGADGSGTECTAEEGTPLTEICDDSLDNDCDGKVDEECTTPPAAESLCDDGIDNDSDTLVDCADADCDSDSVCLVEENTETDCSNIIDDDDNGRVDCYDNACMNDPSCADIVTLDQDGDGYTIQTGDCNDEDSTSYPGAEELCDEIDHDCDVNQDPFNGDVCSNKDIDSSESGGCSMSVTPPFSGKGPMTFFPMALYLAFLIHCTFLKLKRS